MLVLTTTFPKDKNDFGTPRFVFDLANNISGKGIETLVLTPDRPDSVMIEEKISDNFRIKRFKYFLKKKQFLTTGDGIIPNIKKARLNLILIPFLIISQLIHTIRLVRKQKINIVNSHWLIPSGLIGAILQKYLQKKNIVTAHAAGIYLLERIPLGKQITKFIYKNSTRILVVSKYGKERLYNLVSKPKKVSFDKKVKVVPMGVDIKKISGIKERMSFKEKSFNVLFLGRLVEKKGLKYAIKALDLIEDKEVYFHICGFGPQLSELEQLVFDYKLTKNIRFYGSITESEKLKLLNSVDVLLVPSIETAEGDREGLPVVILEALGAGLPIIASNVGGIGDGVITDFTGKLIDQKNSEEIKNAIIQLKNNKKQLNSLRKNCKIHSKNFDWSSITEKYYSEIISS